MFFIFKSLVWKPSFSSLVTRPIPSKVTVSSGLLNTTNKIMFSLFTCCQACYRQRCKTNKPSSCSDRTHDYNNQKKYATRNATAAPSLLLFGPFLFAFRFFGLFAAFVWGLAWGRFIGGLPRENWVWFVMMNVMRCVFNGPNRNWIGQVPIMNDLFVS